MKKKKKKYFSPSISETSLSPLSYPPLPTPYGADIAHYFFVFVSQFESPIAVCPNSSPTTPAIIIFVFLFVSHKFPDAFLLQCAERIYDPPFRNPQIRCRSVRVTRPACKTRRKIPLTTRFSKMLRGRILVTLFMQ